MSDTGDIGLEPAEAASMAPSRRDLLIGAMLAGAAGIAYWRAPHRRMASIGKGQLDRMVPTTIGPWRYQTSSGIVLPPPDALAKLLYDQQLARTYVADDAAPVMLVMAYGSGQNGALQVHRPEICYPASGYRLTNAERLDMPIAGGRAIPVRSFTAESDTRVEQIVYWSRIANRLPTSWTSQRIAIMKENLRGFVPDGLLVRVSTISNDRDSSFVLLERFCRTMLASLDSADRRRLIGDDYA